MTDWWTTDSYAASKAAAAAAFATGDWPTALIHYTICYESLRAQESDPRAAGSGLNNALQKARRKGASVKNACFR